MRFSFKIFLAFFLVIGLGAYLFFSTFISELKPVFRQASEESLVDIANLLAEIASNDLNDDQNNFQNLAAAVKRFQKREFNAQIWSLTKTKPGLQIYITDASGLVIYDSEGKALGQDFSNWNDVYRTLRGDYGARSSLSDPTNILSSVMHVAAPIYHKQKISGVLTVKKANINTEPFFKAAEQNLSRKGFMLLLFALFIGLLLSLWLSNSISQLARYANTVKRGESIKPPKVYGLELSQLASAMSIMKEKLEGSQYIEQYIHTLTHQLKSPITSIKGACELLSEDMPKPQRQQFINNIDEESNKLQRIVQHMLSLAEMESKQSLNSLQTVNLLEIINKTIQASSAEIANKQIKIDLQQAQPSFIQGDLFLIEQAIGNLLENAISFSATNSVITLSISLTNKKAIICIADEGSGIPNYALGHIFERFYSLPRKNKTQKSTGLGLCFVKEIARLHKGSIVIKNKQPIGVKAVLTLALNPLTD